MRFLGREPETGDVVMEESVSIEERPGTIYERRIGGERCHHWISIERQREFLTTWTHGRSGFLAALKERKSKVSNQVKSLFFSPLLTRTWFLVTLTHRLDQVCVVCNKFCRITHSPLRCSHLHTMKIKCDV